MQKRLTTHGSTLCYACIPQGCALLPGRISRRESILWMTSVCRVCSGKALHSTRGGIAETVRSGDVGCLGEVLTQDWSQARSQQDSSDHSNAYSNRCHPAATCDWNGELHWEIHHEPLFWNSTTSVASSDGK